MKLFSKIEYSSKNPITLTLQNIQEWANKWQMKINPIKSSTMKLGRFKTNVTYSINNVDIPEVQSVKDLGLTYDANMRFDDYINNITCLSKNWFDIPRIYISLEPPDVYRTLVSKLDTSVRYTFWRFETRFISRNNGLLMRAYMTYVRPILEYSTCVWSPYMLKDIRQVEDVQRYFTRRMFPKCTLSYSERLAILGLESLECRRLKFDLKMYFKILHHQTNLEPSKFFLFQNHERTKTRGGHSYTLKKHLFSSNRLFNSFCNRAVDCWNALPEDLVTAESYKRFCSKIRKLDITKFVKGM